MITLLGGLIVILFGWWWLFYTDKRSPSQPTELPLVWLGNDLLLTLDDRRLYQRQDKVARTTFYAPDWETTGAASHDICLSRTALWLGGAIMKIDREAETRQRTRKIALQITGWDGDVPSLGKAREHGPWSKPALPDCNADQAEAATTAFLRSSPDYQRDRSFRINGERVPVTRARGAFAGQIEGILFVETNTGGLVHVVGETMTRHPMPEGLISRDSEFLWDSALGRALVLSNSCMPPRKDNACRWTALWLTPGLRPLGQFEMPGASLIEIRAGYSCFSCGCGCYSHQDFYVQNGRIFAHVWGYPVTSAARGIYRFEEAGGVWEKLAAGHTTRPLAISPDGARAAMLELSHFGDKLRIVELP